MLLGFCFPISKKSGFCKSYAVCVSKATLYEYCLHKKLLFNVINTITISIVVVGKTNLLSDSFYSIFIQNLLTLH